MNSVDRVKEQMQMFEGVPLPLAGSVAKKQLKTSPCVCPGCPVEAYEYIMSTSRVCNRGKLKIHLCTEHAKDVAGMPLFDTPEEYAKELKMLRAMRQTGR